jgi:uncharacterized membrane protein
VLIHFPIAPFIAGAVFDFLGNGERRLLVAAA